MMDLKAVVERYLNTAGDFGKPVRLSTFGFNQAETEALFDSLDGDYHINRFLHFTFEAGQSAYTVSGEKVTHVTIDAGVKELL